MITIGEIISRVRNQIKSVKQDAFLTDRVIYSLCMKHAKLLMRRQDSLNKIMKFNSIFQALDFVELIEVDKIEAACHCIQSGCLIKRTKDKIPAMMEGYWGPIIRAITSLDLSQEVYPTYPTMFEKIYKQKTFKYNKTKYYWFIDGYLYFPNIEWDAVRIEGVFEGDVSKFNCHDDDSCAYIQQQVFSVPEFLFSEMEQLVLRDFGFMLQVPSDAQSDNKNIIR